mmetsp:Transcript_39162/g.101370  ORF Transcript_39162/g.101370 Transcript_39162/m.101370 type:complete len:204 (-) Transcript_39162:459-1070(-)
MGATHDSLPADASSSQGLLQGVGSDPHLWLLSRGGANPPHLESARSRPQRCRLWHRIGACPGSAGAPSCATSLSSTTLPGVVVVSHRAIILSATSHLRTHLQTQPACPGLLLIQLVARMPLRAPARHPDSSRTTANGTFSSCCSTAARTTIPWPLCKYISAAPCSPRPRSQRTSHRISRCTDLARCPCSPRSLPMSKMCAPKL